MELRLLVAAGGTGGHFFPALAIVQEAERLGKRCRVCFVGRRDRIEGQLAEAYGYEFVPLPLSSWSPGHLWRSSVAVAKLLWSTVRLALYVRQFRPHAILTTGAYIGMPAGLVARWYRIPLMVVELNVAPGRAVRVLARWADIVATAYEQTASTFGRSERVHVVGAPVRREFLAPPSPAQARQQLGLEGDIPVVAILGGSLGAARLNAVAQRLVPWVEQGQLQLVWQYGYRYALPPELPRRGLLACPFFERPATVLAAADCVVARSGGMTIAEICAVGRAAILVPYPAARDQHQRANAQWMEHRGAAVCVPDACAEAEVPPMVQRILRDHELRESMAAAARQLSRPEAASQLVELLWERCRVTVPR